MTIYFSIYKWIGPDYVNTQWIGDFEVKARKDLLEHINVNESYLFSITEWDKSPKDQDSKIIRQFNAEDYF